MRGISKKELIELIENPQMDLDKYTLRALITRCKELNPWLLIDENTPKDRPLLLFSEDLGQVKGHWSNYPRSPHISNWQTENGVIINPTHYQHLPDAPI